MSLGAFFQALWPVPVDGSFTVTFLPAKWNGADKSKPSLHFPIASLSKFVEPDLDKLRSFGEAKHRHTYFGLAARRLGIKEGRGVKKDCIAIPGFAMDVDLLDPSAHAAGSLPTSYEEAASLFVDYPLPSMVVNSGFGLHPYWLFDTPWIFGPGAYATAEAAIKKFVAPAIANATAYGWRLDACDTVDRIWRLPCFINWKVKSDPHVVEVIDQSDVRYSVKELLASLPAVTVAVSVPGAMASDAPSITTGALADSVRAFCTKLINPERREIMSRALYGLPFAEKGSREKTLQVVCSVLAWIPPGRKADPIALAELVRPSLDAMAAVENDPNNPAMTIDDAIDRITRAQKDYDTKQAKALEAVRATLSKGASVPVQQLADQPITEENKKFILQHAIIQYKSSYYVYDFVQGRYSSAKTREELPVVLVQLWNDDDAPVEMTYIKEVEKGDEIIEQVKKKTLPQLLEEYARVADEVTLDMTIQESSYNVTTNMFREACALRRSLEPRYDSTIDAWLRAFSGEHVDRIYDWLAATIRLDEPVCAIEIVGPPGVGKTLLATGIARIYAETEPTRFDNVVGVGFNADILRCPVILADEGLPKNVRGLGEKVRSLIAAYTHTVSRKYLPNVAVMGCVRVIITTNSDEGLAALADENMSLDDLQAIAGRFFHVRAAIDGEYLKKLVDHDPEILRRWIQDDLLPRHILWIAQSRVLVRKGRFLVEGEMGSVHRQLITSGSIRGLVLEWLVRFLNNPKPVLEHYRSSQEPSRALVQSSEGKLLVNTQSIVDCWELYMGEKRQMPSTWHVGRNLRLVSQGEERPRVIENGEEKDSRFRYHRVRTDIVLDWARQNQIGDLDAMQRRLSMHAISGDNESSSSSSTSVSSQFTLVSSAEKP
jgi:hypothetical protein